MSAFTYDALNRRTQADYADASSTTFAYDSGGRLAVAEDSTSGRIEFTYDTLDRLVKELTQQGVVEYTYDALTVGLGYDAAGRRTSLSYPNGTSTAYSYDIASRLLSIVHDGPAGLIESLIYTYDAAGNRVSLDRANAAVSLLPAPVQAAYDAANEQIQFGDPLPGTPNLTYDANGNLTSQTDPSGTTTYTWDARNRLAAVSRPGVSASFSYDPLGRRMAKSFNGSTTRFQYGNEEIIAEVASDVVDTTYMRSLNIDEALVRQGTTKEYYHLDALGSTLLLTDPSAGVGTTYTYGPFGQVAINGTSANTFQFTGRENDGTGSNFYRARYYNPSLHRFISQDPVLKNLDLLVPADAKTGLRHAYSYAENNPVNFTDPSGLDKSPPWVKKCRDDLSFCNKLATAFSICIVGCVPSCAGIPLPGNLLCFRICSAACTGVALQIKLACINNYQNCIAQCRSQELFIMRAYGPNIQTHGALPMTVMESCMRFRMLYGHLLSELAVVIVTIAVVRFISQIDLTQPYTLGIMMGLVGGYFAAHLAWPRIKQLTSDAVVSSSDTWAWLGPRWTRVFFEAFIAVVVIGAFLVPSESKLFDSLAAFLVGACNATAGMYFLAIAVRVLVEERRLGRSITVSFD